MMGNTYLPLLWTRCGTILSVSLFCVLFYCCHCLESTDSQFPEKDSSITEQEKLKQFVIDKERGVLIVRGEGKIYKLNDRLEKNLSIAARIFENGTNDYLMVIVSNKEILLICQHDGKCEIRNSTNLALMSNKERTTVFYCKKGENMKTFVGTAVNLTRYPGFTPVFGGSYCGEQFQFNIISARSMDNNLAPINDYTITQKETISMQYPVYFRSVIDYSKFILFFTNQKMSIQSNTFTSKIIKICKESEQDKRVAYEDIPITCKNGDKEYNLLRHATLLKVSETNELAKSGICHNKSDYAVIIGIFSSGDPENPDLSSAVCVFSVDSILQEFRESRKRYFEGDRFDGGYMKIQNLAGDTYARFNDTHFCNDDLQTVVNFMGNVSLQGQALHENQETRFTQIESLMTNGFAHVFIGTSDGRLFELYIKDKQTSRVLGKMVTVENGTAVKKIGKLNKRIYAMTENKIVRVASVDCSTYNTCEECNEMAGYPACGWSILTKKCTKREDLQNATLEKYWLPAAHQKCLKLDLDIIGARIGGGSVNVTIKTDPVKDITGFSCSYGNETLEGRGQKPVVQSKCHGIAAKREHKEYPFYLVEKITGNNVIVAKTDFWSYNCTKFDTCNACVENFKKKVTCFWCKENATCIPNSDICINNTGQCPVLEENTQLRIPIGVKEDKTLKGRNIPLKNPKNFDCSLNGRKYAVSNVTETSITCQDLIVNKPYPEEIKVTVNFKGKVLGTTAIEVYNCTQLGRDCSVCRYYMVEDYSCKWCMDKCQHESECRTNNQEFICPGPSITKVSPENSPLGGNTKVTIEGSNFGVTCKDVEHLSVAGISCNVSQKSCDKSSNPKQFGRLQCITGQSNTELRSPVKITVKGKNFTYGNFEYLNPKVTAIQPNTIIKAGGARVTISGTNLNVGNKIYAVTLNDTTKMKTIKCDKPKLSEDNKITCLVAEYSCSQCGHKWEYVDKIKVSFDKNTERELAVNFTFSPNPFGLRLQPNKSFESGGRTVTVQGNNLEYVTNATFGSGTCFRNIGGGFICRTPRYNISNRQKRSAEPQGNVTLRLDGFKQEFNIVYVSDPTIHAFDGDKEFNPNKPENLKIMGENMNLAAFPGDYVVAIGATTCQVIELNTTFLLCIPDRQLDAGRYPVKVVVGNLVREVGHMKYIAVINILLVVSVILSVVIVAIIIGVVLFVRKLKSKKEQAVEKIWLVVRENEEKQRKTMQEEFAMMQTTIKDIKQDVVTTGMPFFDFEHYAFNQLFPKEDYSDHILMKQIPVPHENRTAVEKAMTELDKLIFNKFFITSVIFTLDKERKCTMKDKAQFASMLSVLFLSKMDYFLEVIKLLLSSLIDNTQKRQQKTLFRRAESISTRLLSDWLSLAIYSYLKDGKGAHLFMLYKATQTLMEKCPIDAVTGDSETTLSQEKLLKDTVETETLELTVELGDTGKTYDCKVLDCDTIHQAKAKCLYYIYKNKPASEIPQADDVELEWHEGKAGKLILLDVSGNNEKENRFVRLNTLKDYCVKQGSQMALVGKYEEDDIYVNTVKSHANHGYLVDEHEVKVEVDPGDINWHLVKPLQEDEKVHRPKIADEVYLSRLVRTKLALKEYIDNIFNNVIDAENMDPAIKYLFSLMDKFGSENDVETDTIQVWKSDIYANRIWATLITRPEVVFDIQKATHVEPSLDVIKQALIDSFSMVPHKLGKNSPTQKLLFAAEVKSAQERVHAMYKSLANEDVISEKDMRHIMNKFSSQHGQIGFNKYSVLYQLFLFIKSYIHDILADLDENEDTSALELGGKLDKVIQQMDIEGVGNLNGNANNGSLYTRYV